MGPGCGTSGHWRSGGRPYDGRMDFVVAFVPSIGLGIIFVVIMRAILLADRRERAAFRKFEMEENAGQVGGRDNTESTN